MEEAAMMPVHGQEFCLRWNNYHSSLSNTLDGFKNDKDFVDVTLACEGQYLFAHKMLLSACSVYFRDLIKVNPCQHPIIILPQEVQFADMEKLLRFIYQGEVNVLQENLSRFLKTAEMFKIRGLAEDSEKQKVLRTCSPGQGSPCPSNSSGGGTAAGDCSGTSPKRPRLSLDTTSAASSLANATNTSISNNTTSQSTTNNALTVTSSSSSNSNCTSATLVLDTPATPNNEDSTHSANDSDSEMLPVKQEMVELKACDDFETDSEPFNPDKYLKEGVVMTTSASASNDSGSSNNKQQPPPPPPGPLLPSYVPPPPIKAQEDSPVGGNASDELSQGGMSVRLMSGGVMVGVPYPPPPHLRPHHQCDTPPSRYTGKRKSPALGGSGGSMRRSPPPYSVPGPPSVFQSQIPASRRSSPNFNTPNQQILPPVSRRSSPNTFNGQPPNMSSSSSSSSSVLKRSPSFTNKSPRYRKSPVLSTSSASTFKGTPSNNIKMSPPHSQSPKSCGPSPNSPPPKLGHSYSSPDLSFSAKGSPDENMLPRGNCVSAAALGALAAGGGHSNGVGSLMCDICHKTFTSRSNLNKHKRVQHSGEEYRCQLCNRTFKNRYYIKEHLTICASANQKKAAAAVAGNGGDAAGGGACSAPSVMTSSPALPTAAISYSMTAGTPPAHLSAAHPAPSLHTVAAAPAPHDFFKYEPPDDEQPTDLAIHSRSSARQSNSPA